MGTSKLPVEDTKVSASAMASFLAVSVPSSAYPGSDGPGPPEPIIGGVGNCKPELLACHAGVATVLPKFAAEHASVALLPRPPAGMQTSDRPASLSQGGN